jgi:16S rRNA G966 N2-methylase RsmD
MRRIREPIADLIHNVDTFRWAPDAVPNSAERHPYDPTPWWALRGIFKDLQLDFPRFTFIDIDAGKGRVVLAAAAFPFLSVIGVEFSRSLCRIAENNLVTCRCLRRRAQNARMVECDATEFALPATPCLLYFYNPFSSELMQIVVKNIIDSYRKSPRDLYLICVGGGSRQFSRN